MKHIVLLTLFLSLVHAEQKAVFHYRSGGTIVESLPEIDSITFAEVPEGPILIDSIKYRIAHGSLPPKYQYHRSYVLRKDDSYTFKSYQGYEAIEDSLLIEIENIRDSRPLFEHVVESLQNRCGKQLNGNFIDKDLVGGPASFIELYFNDGTKTRFWYNSTRYAFIPPIIKSLDKTIVDTLLPKID